MLLCEVIKAAERLPKNHFGISVEVRWGVVRTEVGRLLKDKPMAGEKEEGMKGETGKLFSLPIWAAEEACGGRNGEGEGGARAQAEV